MQAEHGLSLLRCGLLCMNAFWTLQQRDEEPHGTGNGDVGAGGAEASQFGAWLQSPRGQTPPMMISSSRQRVPAMDPWPSSGSAVSPGNTRRRVPPERADTRHRMYLTMIEEA